MTTEVDPLRLDCLKLSMQLEMVPNVPTNDSCVVIQNAREFYQFLIGEDPVLDKTLDQADNVEIVDFRHVKYDGHDECL